MALSRQTLTLAVQDPAGAVRLSRAGVPKDAADRSGHPLCRLCA
jgi:hypothetical protein